MDLVIYQQDPADFESLIPDVKSFEDIQNFLVDVLVEGQEFKLETFTTARDIVDLSEAEFNLSKVDRLYCLGKTESKYAKDNFIIKIFDLTARMWFGRMCCEDRDERERVREREGEARQRQPGDARQRQPDGNNDYSFPVYIHVIFCVLLEGQGGGDPYGNPVVLIRQGLMFPTEQLDILLSVMEFTTQPAQIDVFSNYLMRKGLYNDGRFSPASLRRLCYQTMNDRNIPYDESTVPATLLKNLEGFKLRSEIVKVIDSDFYEQYCCVRNIYWP